MVFTRSLYKYFQSYLAIRVHAYCVNTKIKIRFLYNKPKKHNLQLDRDGWWSDSTRSTRFALLSSDSLVTMTVDT